MRLGSIAPVPSSGSAVIGKATSFALPVINGVERADCSQTQPLIHRLQARPARSAATWSSTRFRTGENNIRSSRFAITTSSQTSGSRFGVALGKITRRASTIGNR